MIEENYELWDDLTFKTTSYRKNFDVIIESENIITEHIGEISKIRMFEKKPPVILGDYGFTTLNIKIAKELNFDVKQLIHEFNQQLAFDELNNLIINDKFNPYDYDKILIIQNFVLSIEYRKMGVLEEFIEMLYREHYNEKVAIIALVLPFQYNEFDFEYYNEYKKIKKRNDIKGLDSTEVLIMDEFSLRETINKNNDRETNEYKLFAVADRCGFERIGDSYLFLFNNKKTLERLKQKYVFLKKINYLYK